jgi:hypothetical protein
MNFNTSTILFSINYSHYDQYYINKLQYEKELINQFTTSYNSIKRDFTLKEEHILINEFTRLYTNKFHSLSNCYTESIPLHHINLNSIQLLLGDYNYNLLNKCSNNKEFHSLYLITILFHVYIKDKDNEYEDEHHQQQQEKYQQECQIKNKNKKNITTSTTSTTSTIITTPTIPTNKSTTIHHQTKVIDKRFYYGYYINVYHKTNYSIYLNKLNINQLEIIWSQLYSNIVVIMDKDSIHHHHHSGKNVSHHNSKNIQYQFSYKKDYKFSCSIKVSILNKDNHNNSEHNNNSEYNYKKHKIYYICKGEFKLVTWNQHHCNHHDDIKKDFIIEIKKYFNQKLVDIINKDLLINSDHFTKTIENTTISDNTIQIDSNLLNNSENIEKIIYLKPTSNISKYKVHETVDEIILNYSKCINNKCSNHTNSGNGDGDNDGDIDMNSETEEDEE